MEFPDFDAPPVTEVALAVQFDRLETLRTPHLGLFWSEFRNKFPFTEEHPPRDAVIERFEPQPPVDIRLQFDPAPATSRIWLLNEARTQVIQIQQDRFVHNWRKIGDRENYPRYESILGEFERELSMFSSFLEREQIGYVTPNQCEITYVNRIPLSNEVRAHDILTVFNEHYSGEFLPDYEDLRLQLRYLISNEINRPIGRLYISSYTVFQNETPIFVFTLIARGRPEENDMDGVKKFLDRGREWIVKGFTSVTTPKMHDQWGKSK